MGWYDDQRFHGRISPNYLGGESEWSEVGYQIGSDSRNNVRVTGGEGREINNSRQHARSIPRGIGVGITKGRETFSLEGRCRCQKA